MTVWTLSHTRSCWGRLVCWRVICGRENLDIKDFLFQFCCSFWSVCCRNNWPGLHKYYIVVSFCTEIRASLPATLSGTQIQEHCGADDLGQSSEDTPRVLMSYIRAEESLSWGGLNAPGSRAVELLSGRYIHTD